MKANVSGAVRHPISTAESFTRKRHGNLHDGMALDSSISP
jgi:hypothetical protein